MKEGIKKSVHDLAALYVKTSRPDIEKSRHEDFVENIDKKINKLKQNRKDKAVAFLKSRK